MTKAPVKAPPRKPGPKPAAPAPKAIEGERIAKVLARAGVASRREAERMIQLGEVSVNGKVIDSPALNVKPSDRIALRGQPLAAAEPTRVWLYYKPIGLVTTTRDDQGRPTVFDNLPEDMPRVMSIGRLDLNSEGLLLLTNDGDLKRKLELPSTGWLRKYRVRINGRPEDTAFDPLRKGITIDGEHFQPMTITLDRQQGANCWLTVALREGKNREIRRAMEAVGFTVNRLIRISYGPFKLDDLPPGDVQELRPRVLRDQLGLDGSEDPAPTAKPRGVSTSARSGAPRAPRPVKTAPAQDTPPARRGTTAKGAAGLAASATRFIEGMTKGKPRAKPAEDEGAKRPPRPKPPAKPRQSTRNAPTPRK